MEGKSDETEHQRKPKGEERNGLRDQQEIDEDG